MKILNRIETVDQIFLALDDENTYLVVGEKLSLEKYSSDCDGIFPTLKSWNSFVQGNFINGEYFRDELKPTTIKKWCMPVIDFNHKFVVSLGGGTYATIDADKIEYSYDYELYYRAGSNKPTSVEFFITARLKA